MLLKRYKHGVMSWDDFVVRYKAEMGGDAAIQAMRDILHHMESQNVTLLCYEPEGAPCHRYVLRDMILDMRPV